MPGAVFLEGDRVALTTIEREDVPFVVEHSNDPAMRRFTGHRLPDSRRRIEEHLLEADDDGVSLLVRADGEAVGLVGLSPRSPTRRTVFGLTGTAEIGLWIAPAAQGEGYGGEAAERVVDYAFDELRMHKVSARVFAYNEASRRLFEDRLGFEREGIQRDEVVADGEFHDVYYYGVLESEWRDREG
jgi:RimJ/RimL family protein N-acetyltransferase